MTRVLFLGEAWGAQEEKISAALVGPSGVELLRMCDEAGLLSLTSADVDYIREFYRTGDPRQIDMIWRLHPELGRANVFNFHPPGNDLSALFGGKKQGIAGWPKHNDGYLLPEYAHELDRVEAEILAFDPNLIVALGNTPLWATCAVTAIYKLRGSTRIATH